MGGGNPSAGIAKQQAAQQSQIDQGMQQLNSIFFGGTYGTDPSSAYSAGRSYFDAGGKPINFDPTQNTDFSSWLKKQGGQQKFAPGTDAQRNKIINQPKPTYMTQDAWNQLQQKELAAIPTGALLPNEQAAYGNSLAKGGRLFGGTATSEGFTPQFFQNAENAYVQNALPQLASQANQTQKSIDFKEANQGLLGSSAARGLNTAFGKEFANQKQNIANAALGTGQQLQKDVNQQYQTLVGQLEASANPAATTTQALQAASAFSAPTAFPAIGSLFNNFANTYLASQLGGIYGNPYNGGYGAPAMRLPSSSFSAPVVTTG